VFLQSQPVFTIHVLYRLARCHEADRVYTGSFIVMGFLSYLRVGGL